MKQFTVMLYEGSVDCINRPIAKYIMEAETLDEVSFLKPFINQLDVNKVYYTRGILWSDILHTYDYGSYSRFIAVAEGDLDESQINEMLKQKN